MKTVLENRIDALKEYCREREFSLKMKYVFYDDIERWYCSIYNTFEREICAGGGKTRSEAIKDCYENWLYSDPISE